MTVELEGAVFLITKAKTGKKTKIDFCLIDRHPGFFSSEELVILEHARDM